MAVFVKLYVIHEFPLPIKNKNKNKQTNKQNKNKKQKTKNKTKQKPKKEQNPYSLFSWSCMHTVLHSNRYFRWTIFGIIVLNPIVGEHNQKFESIVFLE